MRFAVLFLFLLKPLAHLAQDEPYLSNQTYTYDQAIAEYKALATKYPQYCTLQDYGSSDYGLPVSLFMINKSGKFYPREFDNKIVFLVNNAIHPGEPEGVDASIKLCKDLLADTAKIPANVILAVIPIYNIGGAHNRNCCTRANQNGPEEYGFRGNAKNLDLNRDFIKADSKNTLAFYTIFQLLKPAVFVDTHTSNGADYQYVMTLITSQVNKMNPVLAEYVSGTMNPRLYKQMEKKGYPMVPYVHTLNEIPDEGIIDFMETPRYSTGYTNLFNTIGFVAETHMLKPFDQRVEATYELLDVILRYMDEHHAELKELKKAANDNLYATESFALNWELDTSRYEMLDFLGYEAEYRKSEVTGQDRLCYNQDKPCKIKVPYYNTYTAKDIVKRPEYYIIPQAWDDVVLNLRASGVKVMRLKQDVRVNVEVYTVIRFETIRGPYEGHYLHYEVEVDKDISLMSYRKGDYVIPTRNDHARFIIETLEPHAVDSYLAWNYFDAVLQQKEWFSAYVFEDEAAKILAEDPALKAELDAKKNADAEFAGNAFAQLYFIYKHTDHYEPTHNRYPVTRYMNKLEDTLLEEVLIRY
jgi:hypothetical protein